MTTNGMPRVRPIAEAATLALIDLVSLFIIFNCAVFFRKTVLPALVGGLPAELPFSGIRGLWWVVLIWMFFFWYEGLYSRKLSFWDEVNALWKVSVLSTAGIFVMVSLGKLSAEISRTVVLLMGLISMIVMPVVRIPAKKMFRQFGLFRRRVLILGAGTTGRLILNALRKEPNYGYEVIGFLDDDPQKIGTRISGVKVHRGVDRASLYLRNCRIQDVFIAMPGAGKEKLQTLINRLQHEAENVLFVPDLFGVAVIGTDLHHFFHEQAFVLSLKNNLAKPVNVLLKRISDIVIGLLLLPFTLLLGAIFAVLIKLDSPGPVLFTQQRIGRRGAPFLCYKFRTMQTDADERLEQLLGENAMMKEEWERHWKIKDDPRITRIGRLLRKTSLDELPQLINVLKGEMSIVGPRPYLHREQEYLKDFEDVILSVVPGITGLWQVSGRSESSYAYRLNLDSWYVRNWNLWLDLVILFKTLRVVVYREGAY